MSERVPGAGGGPPLDVDRLRHASQTHRRAESAAWAAKGEYHVSHVCGDGDCWDKIATEYARLSVNEGGVAFRCDRIVNNGMGEPTECGRTLPCEYHDGGGVAPVARTEADDDG